MAKEEDKDEIIAVEVDENNKPIDTQDGDAGSDRSDDQEDGDDTDDVEDRRLADDDEEDDGPNGHRRPRHRRRREAQRRHRDANEREIQMLREKTANLEAELGRVTGRISQGDQQSLENQINQARRDVETAERVMAGAMNAGNGEDHLTALRYRDAARDRVNQLAQQKSEMEQQAAQPQLDQRIVSHASEWQSANPWYNAHSTDEESQLVNKIDLELTNSGYDPRTRAFWEELTARVSDAMAGDDDAPAGRQGGQPAQRGRGGPPVGNSRNHAPVSTRTEVYVTAERKAAMQEAGIWDDPVRRQRALREFRDYDARNSAR